MAREGELAVMREFLETNRPSERAIVLTGGPGIGKTTLWEAATDVARAAGMRLLSARPSSAEAGLPFASLIDLCETVGADVLSGIPAPQRLALEVALLRAEPRTGAPEPHAIALGFLGAVRALAAQATVVIAIDDVQWLDPSSAEVLAFAVRRLSPYPVRLVLARRPGAHSALERALEHSELRHMEVGPLSFGATRALLGAARPERAATGAEADHRLHARQPAVRARGRACAARARDPGDRGRLPGPGWHRGCARHASRRTVRAGAPTAPRARPRRRASCVRAARRQRSRRG